MRRADEAGLVGRRACRVSQRRAAASVYVIALLGAGCSADSGAALHGPAQAARALAASDAGAPAPGFDERVSALVQPLIDGAWVRGIEVALLAAGRLKTYGFGATREGGPAPDEQTLFEIGSITKTFTGLLLAELVNEGRVRLDQPVAELLPSGVRVPDFDGQPITLVDLATHTSGLPRLPNNLLGELTTPESVLDPYAQYDEADLFEFLATYELTAAPGSVEEYSNIGFGLLGYALARAEGTSYSEAVARHITDPLGMVDTSIALSDEQRARFATGHDAELEARPAWHFLAPTEAAGALRSTARDMAIYLLAQGGLDDGSAPDGGLTAGAERAALQRSIELTHQVFREVEGSIKPGLGWFLARDEELVLHNGGTGGFESFALYDKRYDFGVVVLSNTAGDDRYADYLGFELLTLLYGGEPTPVPTPRAAGP